MNGERDPDFLDQFKDIERRLRILESTPRIPQVSTSTRGPQSAVSTQDVVLSSSGAETSLITDTEIVVPVGPAGYFILMLGGEMGATSTSGVFLNPRIWNDDTGEEIFAINSAWPRAIDTNGATGLVSASASGRLWVGSSFNARCVLEAAKVSGAYTAEVRYAWQIGIPI